MLTFSGFPFSADSANIFPPTLNTDVSGPNGNVSSAPESFRQRPRS